MNVLRSLQKRPTTAVLLSLATALAVILAAVLLWRTGGAVPSQAEVERLCVVDAGVSLRQWTHIVIHHSGTAQNDAATIDAYHRHKRGWLNGLGYDFVIGNGTLSGDGEIEVSARWKRQQQGAHCPQSGMNRHGIGICFVGNFEHTPGPSKNQLRAGELLVGHLAARFSVPPDNVLGHGQVPGARTKCPGRFFPMVRMRQAARPR